MKLLRTGTIGWVVVASLHLFAVAAVAEARVFPPLPAPEFADTEVCACFPLDCANGVRSVGFSLEFNGTPSNNVQVALGRDADGDGVLQPHETDLVAGWRRGRYFVENVAGAERIWEDAVGTDGGRRVLQLRMDIRNGAVRRFAATNETGAVFHGLSASAPAWLRFSGWNLARLTARGLDVQDEHFGIKTEGAFFRFILR